MSIEIKELVIRASVGAKEPRGCCGEDESEGSSAQPEIDRAAVVRAAVAEVLRVLRASKER
jgi:hypothetical protein